jgi:glycosyltransferase involved in cell wall biosynthesis
MSDAKKHIALVIVNLRPGMDGGSSTMLELMYEVGRLGYKSSLYNFFTDEPRHRNLLTDKMIPKGAAPADSHIDTYQYRDNGIDCHIRFLPFTVHELGERRNEAIKMIIETIGNHQIDYVLTADRSSVLAVHVLKIPGAHFFRSVGNIERVHSMHPAYLSSITKRDCTAGSAFLKGRIKEVLGLDATVIKPVIDFDAYVTTHDPEADAVGFYALGYLMHKGDEVVNKVTRKMPETKFLIVGEGYHRYAPFPANVTYWGHRWNMKDFYRNIKVMLVPSLHHEGFSRVTVEAAANGIPTIANRMGGIPEALGNSGVLIDVDSYPDVDIEHLALRYVEEIQRVLTKRDVYETLKEKALKQAGQHAAEQENTLRSFFQHRVQ